MLAAVGIDPQHFRLQAGIDSTVAAAANDSGTISQNYAAGATLSISVQTPAAGCTTSPSDANAVIQYKMQ